MKKYVMIKVRLLKRQGGKRMMRRDIKHITCALCDDNSVIHRYAIAPSNVISRSKNGEFNFNHKFKWPKHLKGGFYKLEYFFYPKKGIKTPIILDLYNTQRPTP